MPLTNLFCDETLVCDELLPCEGGISVYPVEGTETLSLVPAVPFVHSDATYPGPGTYPGAETYPGGWMIIVPVTEDPVELTLEVA